jgi:hypothetical protein
MVISRLQATESLLAVMPASILAIAATNTAEAASIISSELIAPTPPAWFLSLPPAVQTYFITSANGAAVNSIESVSSLATIVTQTSEGSVKSSY